MVYKEEMVAYSDLSECEYAVDLDLEDGKMLWKKWKKIMCFPFLNAERSKKVLRSFHVPIVSKRMNVYNDYCLFKRP